MSVMTPSDPAGSTGQSNASEIAQADRAMPPGMSLQRWRYAPDAWRMARRVDMRHVDALFRARSAAVLPLESRGRFLEMLLACQCDAQGRKGLEDRPYPQRDYLAQAHAAAAAVQLAPDDIQGREGAMIAQILHRKRLEAIRELPRPSGT